MDDPRLDRVRRAICAEDCAFRGEPPCYEIDPRHFPPETCDEPGCTAYAIAALMALDAPPARDRPRGR